MCGRVSLPAKRGRRDNLTAMNEKNASWIFDGPPDLIEVRVDAAGPDQGGYVVIFQLATGIVRLCATSNPARYVRAWRQNARRYGIPDITRVIVSRPLIRYESIKRAIGDALMEYRQKSSDAFDISVEALMDKAKIVLAEAGKGAAKVPCASADNSA